METNLNNPKPSHNGRTVAGLIILVIGGMLLIDQLDLFFIPHWLFSAPMWLIGYGLYLGAKYNFRKPVWVILMFIGVALLFSENIDNAGRIIWPIGIIGVGIWMVTKENRRVGNAPSQTDYKV
jgi:hypothetical protein